MMGFDIDVLRLDPAAEAERVARFISEQVTTGFRRKGVVVGLSGGIDSACTAALSVRALGKEKVVGLVLPEKESNPVSSEFAIKHAQQLGIEYRQIDITPTVDSVASYACRDEYIRQLVPEYRAGYKYNITLPTDLLDRDTFSIYNLQVQMPDGELIKKRLSLEEFRAVTSFANIKIRSRMLHLYAEADRRSLVVAGTTNLTEFILGDFCKYGDGGTDIEPICHLYKNQIYQLAEYLNIVPEIVRRKPSPDTFSLPVTDQEFFFRIAFDKLDHLLYGWEHQVPAGEMGRVLNLPEAAVIRAYKDFSTKNRATAHLRVLPATLERVR
jgi:NAD+ synthase